MKLASLCAGISNAIVRGQLLLTEGLTVQSILDENSEAMADGGTLGEASTKIQGLAAGGYHTVRAVSVIIGLIGLSIFGLSFFLSGSQGIAEKKVQIPWKAIGLIITLGAVPIILFAESVANGIFGG